MALPDRTTLRSIAGAATPTYLTSSLAGSYSNPQTFTLATTSGWYEVSSSGTLTTNPLGTSGPFTLKIDYGTATEETILCSGAITPGANSTITVWYDGVNNGRGYDGTPIQAHSAGSASNYNVFPVQSATADLQVNQTIAFTAVTSGSNTFTAPQTINSSLTVSGNQTVVGTTTLSGANLNIYSSTIGGVSTFSGAVLTYNNTQWVAASGASGGATGNYLPLAGGGTVSGQVVATSGVAGFYTLSGTTFPARLLGTLPVTTTSGPGSFLNQLTNTFDAETANAGNIWGIAFNKTSDIYTTNAITIYKTVSGSTTATSTITPPGSAAPYGIAIDPAQNIYYSTFNQGTVNSVLRVASGSTSSTIVASGNANGAVVNRPLGLTTDPKGNLFIANQLNNNILRVASGTTTATSVVSGGVVQNPTQVVLDNQQNLYVGTSAGALLFVTSGTYTPSIVYSGASGPSTYSQLALDPQGNLYYSSNNNVVWRVNSGSNSPYQLTNVAAAAQGLGIDPTNTLWVGWTNGGTGNGAIGKITNLTPSGAYQQGDIVADSRGFLWLNTSGTPNLQTTFTRIGQQANNPVIRKYASSTQAAAGTSTNINFNNINYNVGGFGTSAASGVTVPQSGYYQIQGSLYITTISGVLYGSSIYVNGSLVNQSGFFVAPAVKSVSTQFNDTQYVASGQLISIAGYNSTASGTWNQNSSTLTSYLTVSLISN